MQARRMLDAATKSRFPTTAFSLLNRRLHNVYSLHSTVIPKVCEIWGPHSGQYEDDWLLGRCAVQCGKSLPTFQRSLLPPSTKKLVSTQQPRNQPPSVTGYSPEKKVTIRYEPFNDAFSSTEVVACQNGRPVVTKKRKESGRKQLRSTLRNCRSNCLETEQNQNLVKSTASIFRVTLNICNYEYQHAPSKRCPHGVTTRKTYRDAIPRRGYISGRNSNPEPPQYAPHSRFAIRLHPVPIQLVHIFRTNIPNMNF
jgi:hypothetical protein